MNYASNMSSILIQALVIHFYLFQSANLLKINLRT